MRGKQEDALPISSSRPPDFPELQVQLFREVMQLMNDCKIPYVVAGAFALRKHTGISRDTKDLDLFMPAQNAGAALQELARAGFETEVADPVWLAKAHRDSFYVDLITGMSNGVVTVDQSWIERGVKAAVMGMPVCVIAPEELFASKLFVTRRERFDGADLCHIIYGMRGKLDWPRVMRLVGEEHWELVLWAILLFHYVYPAHSGFVPRALWDDLLARARGALDDPDTSAGFRGSLIDPRMFAIDVEEWGLPDASREYSAKREKIVMSNL